MRTVMFILSCLAASCGGASSNPPPAEPVDFPLPPLSATVVGALLNAADTLALDDAQLHALQDLDAPLRERYDLAEREIAGLRDSGPPRPPAGGGPPRLGVRGGPGGGGMGGPGGGGPGGPAGPGGPGGPPPTERPRPAPADAASMRAARARADQLEEARDREMRATAEQALALLRPDQLEAARAVIADYFNRPRLGPP